ncbi:unnamed protein product, partial [Durusdinium trenchii]
MIGAMIVNIGGSISTTHFRPNAPITPRRSGLEYSTDAKAFVDEDTGAQEKNNSFCLSLQTSRFHDSTLRLREKERLLSRGAPKVCAGLANSTGAYRGNSCHGGLQGHCGLTMK